MRIVTALFIAVLVGVPALATAFGTPAATPTSDERAARAMTHFADATKTSLFVPADSVLIGHVVDGSFVFDAVPGANLATGIGNTGADCNNDVLRDYYSWPTPYPLTANVMAAVSPNLASAGMCTGGTLAGPVTLMQFKTTGYDSGGLYLQGYDMNGWYYGELSIWCSPAAAGGGVGVGNTYVTTLQVQDAWCDVYEWGIQPSEYGTFTGNTYNWNTFAGSTAVSVN